MKTRKSLLAGLVALAVGVVAAACADGPSALRARPQPLGAIAALAKGGKNGGSKGTDQIDPSQYVDTLSRAEGVLLAERWASPLSAEASASATIGSDGGWVELPSTGTYLYVPKGTVSAATTFSIKAVAGRVVAFDFEPAGAVFKTPVFLVQDKANLSNTPLMGLLGAGGATQQLGYFSDDAKLDQSLMTATGSQLRADVLDGSSQYVAYPVFHFSGYIVSWGFASRE